MASSVGGGESAGHRIMGKVDDEGDDGLTANPVQLGTDDQSVLDWDSRRTYLLLFIIQHELYTMKQKGAEVCVNNLDWNAVTKRLNKAVVANYTSDQAQVRYEKLLQIGYDLYPQFTMLEQLDLLIQCISRGLVAQSMFREGNIVAKLTKLVTSIFENASGTSSEGLTMSKADVNDLAQEMAQTFQKTLESMSESSGSSSDLESDQYASEVQKNNVKPIYSQMATVLGVSNNVFTPLENIPNERITELVEGSHDSNVGSKNSKGPLYKYKAVAILDVDQSIWNGHNDHPVLIKMDHSNTIRSNILVQHEANDPEALSGIPVSIAPSGAPTLSKLLALPMRDSGQPLPQISTLMNTASEPDVITLDSSPDGSVLSAAASVNNSPTKFPTRLLDSPTKLLASLGTSTTPVKLDPFAATSSTSSNLPPCILSLSDTLKDMEVEEIDLANEYVIDSGLISIEGASIGDGDDRDQSSPNKRSAIISPLPEVANQLETTSPLAPSLLPSSSSVSLAISSTFGIQLEQEKQPSSSILLEDPKVIMSSPTKMVASGSVSSSTTPPVAQPTTSAPVNEEEEEDDVVIVMDGGAGGSVVLGEVMNQEIKEVGVVEGAEVEEEREQVFVNDGTTQTTPTIQKRGVLVLLPRSGGEEVITVSGGSSPERRSRSGRRVGAVGGEGVGGNNSSEPSTTLSSPITRNKEKLKSESESSSDVVVAQPPSTRRSSSRMGQSEQDSEVASSSGAGSSSTPVVKGHVQRRLFRPATPEVTSTPTLRSSRRGPTPTLLVPEEESAKSKRAKLSSTGGGGEEKETVAGTVDEYTYHPDLSDTMEVVGGGGKHEEAITDHATTDDDVVEVFEREPVTATPRKPGRPCGSTKRRDSGDGEEDENSNSGTDGPATKRLTRRSVKIASPQKDSNNAALDDGKDEKDTKAKQNKGTPRLKSVGEESAAEKEEEKRITRARASKTAASPSRIRTKSTSSGSSKVNARKDEDTAETSESEPPVLPRATRSRLGTASPAVVIEVPTTNAFPQYPDSPASSVENTREDYVGLDPRFKDAMLGLVNQIESEPESKALEIPDDVAFMAKYKKLIKCPMDLGMIKKNIESGAIKTMSQLEKDFNLLFLNLLMLSILPGIMVHTSQDLILYMSRYTKAVFQRVRENPKSYYIMGDENFEEFELSEDLKPKASTSSSEDKPAGRKRRIRSIAAADETPESKRRTLRTSTAAATTATTSWQSSRSKKTPTASPDIASLGKGRQD